MQSLEKKRSDQTPSRFFYRWERLRLTPYFRRIIDYGIPLFLIVFNKLYQNKRCQSASCK